jgi:hypothetical protein
LPGICLAAILGLRADAAAGKQRSALGVTMLGRFFDSFLGGTQQNSCLMLQIVAIIVKIDWWLGRSYYTGAVFKKSEKFAAFCEYLG